MSLDLLDPSKRSAAHLNTLLTTDGDMETSEDVVVLDDKLAEKRVLKVECTEDTEMKFPKQEHVEILTVKLDEARREAPVLDRTTERNQARLLIFTQDDSIFQEGSVMYRRIKDISMSFLEIHIVVLNYRGTTPHDAITRIFDTVWVYPTDSKSWWTLSYDAYRIALAQLAFGGGFRADIVIVEDTCEAGIPGLLISKKYKRPFQVHIETDFYDETYILSHKHPSLFSWCTKFVLEYATSVRTKTSFQRDAVIQEKESLAEVTELFPHYYTLDAWKDSVPTMSLHERYPQYKFIILHITTMHTSDHTTEVISASAKILRLYPALGMVVVGNGPLRAACERLVLFFEIQNQVQFELTPPEYLSHMKSANVFIHVSEDATQDDLILMAAMAKVPIIGNKDSLSGKLFVSNHSALLCPPDSIDCIAQSINQYLNENLSRTTFVNRAYDSVIGRVDQNYDAYLASYVSSIERCIQPVVAENSIIESSPQK